MNHYSLSINDGVLWCLSATTNAYEWLSKFAAILQLDFNSSVCFENKFLHLHFIIWDQNVEISNTKKHQHPILKPFSSIKNNYRNFPSVRISRNGESDYHCEIITPSDERSAVLSMSYAIDSIYERAMTGGGFPFHSALLEMNGNGYLVAGPGGTGKSTCCARIPVHWNALCDDEVLIVRDKDGHYYCHPFPTWSDYIKDRAKNTWNVQHHVPLKAIFYLEQSDTDQIIPLGRGVTATRTYESAEQICMRYWIHGTTEENRREKRLVFENACDMAQKIPAYTLRATLHGRFWEEMERVIDEL